MLSFFSRRKRIPKRHVTHALRVSINEVDYPLCTEETTSNNAFARATIFSGAALVNDALCSLASGTPPAYMLGSDPELAYAPIRHAHRTAIIGLIVFTRNASGAPNSPIEKIFQHAPLSGSELSFFNILTREAEQNGGAAVGRFCSEIGIQLAAPDPVALADQLVHQLQVRHRQLLELSWASDNQPFLDFLRSEIL